MRPSAAAAIACTSSAAPRAAAERAGVILQVGHLLRYHPEEPNLVVRHIDQPVDAPGKGYGKGKEPGVEIALGKKGV